MSVFVMEGDTDGPEIDFVGISKATNSMLDIKISIGDICKKLKQLKDDKSPAPDGIHPIVLKKMSEIVALPIKLIFNRFMVSNKLPLEWKCAQSSQICKRGSIKYKPMKTSHELIRLIRKVISTQIRKSLKLKACIS